MKKRILLGITLVLVIAVGAVSFCSFCFSDDEPVWTTRSNAARAELEEGFEYLHRHYWYDAALHFERALELDTEFAIAKLYLSYVKPRGSSEYRRLVGELYELDLTQLNPREQYLIRYWLTVSEQGADAGRKILDEFLEEFPTDLFALEASCDIAWNDRDWEGTESCYQRLIELHPNWFQAHDRLGFLAMATGRFSDAEEHFHTYRYIAPDQAAPYNSMAQLLIVLGRYEEAEKSLGKALALKEDDCSAYVHLSLLYAFWNRPSQAAAVVDTLEKVEACSHLRTRGILCLMRVRAAYIEGDFEKAWGFVEGCDEDLNFDVLVHHVTVASGRLVEAEAMEAKLAIFLAEEGDSLPPSRQESFLAAQEHAVALRLLVGHEYERATERLLVADETLHYWNVSNASFKLFNRLTLAHSLELAGKTAEAEAMRRQIGAVNPSLQDVRLKDLEELAQRP
jgi:tetratricopeptide (TPR) repeat protein